MKVFILSHDLSHNCLGRAVLLAQLLSRRHEVEIVGPSFGADIWFPCRGLFPYRKVEGELFLPQFTSLFARLLDKLKGDAILAVKPRPTSFGLALMHRELRGRKIWLDLDDDEMALYEGEDWKSWDRKTLLRRPNSPLYTAMLERMIPAADARSAASRALAERHGADYLPHAKDPEFLNPERYDMKRERDRRDLPLDEKLVLFAGSPREHKGLDLALDAIEKLGRDDVKLVVMGAANDPDSAVERELRRRGGERLYMLKQFPMDELPSALAVADAIVVPQRATAAAAAQVPSKLFDAMAMAKPIVATDVSDAREILSGGCGWIAPPEDASALAQAIGEALESPREAAARGQAARRKLIAEYSFAAVEERAEAILKKVAREKTTHASAGR